MELQNGAIVIIIIILSFILISYAIYLIYSENKELKKKLNEVYNNMNNLETNITNLFSQQQENDNDDEDQESNLSESEEDEHEHQLISFNTNKPSLEMFGNSSEELEYLKQFQNKIQQGIIEEIDDEDDVVQEDDEVEQEDDEVEQEDDNVVQEDDNVVQEIKEEIKINISSKNKKCGKILTHGKRKDQECNRHVTGSNDVCKLHLS